MTRVVSVTKKGQATIPKNLREKFGIGDRVLVVETMRASFSSLCPNPKMNSAH